MSSIPALACGQHGHDLLEPASPRWRQNVEHAGEESHLSKTFGTIAPVSPANDAGKRQNAAVWRSVSAELMCATVPGVWPVFSRLGDKR